MSHIGSRFGDDFRLDAPALQRIRESDLEMIGAVERRDSGAFLETIQRTKNRQRVDGVCPIYTLLETLNPAAGKLLRYEQGLEPEANSVVTFASMGFFA